VQEKKVPRKTVKLSAPAPERYMPALFEQRSQHVDRGPANGADDPFAEFREDHDQPTGILRLMPLAGWAKIETRTPTQDQEPAPKDEVSQLLAGLSVPPQVAVISYPRGCRIRRVRVRALEQPPPGKVEGGKPVIVSRRALRSGTGHGL
jgi:hypothetical protein